MVPQRRRRSEPVKRTIQRITLLVVAFLCLGQSDCYTGSYVGYGYGGYGYGPGYYDRGFYGPPMGGYGFYGMP
jgi:hypothetical protein